MPSLPSAVSVATVSVLIWETMISPISLLALE
jgi:hypothetical protein